MATCRTDLATDPKALCNASLEDSPEEEISRYRGPTEDPFSASHLVSCGVRVSSTASLKLPYQDRGTAEGEPQLCVCPAAAI
jgi:hypothetical protein